MYIYIMYFAVKKTVAAMPGPTGQTFKRQQIARNLHDEKHNKISPSRNLARYGGDMSVLRVRRGRTKKVVKRTTNRNKNHFREVGSHTKTIIL